MGKTKQKVSVVFIGHVDSGKSTTSGHLVFKCGGIDKRTIEKYEKESAEAGKGSFKYAWVLDKERSERERGITINHTTVPIQTTRNIATVVDAPGHRDFLKNMISGASNADVAYLVVPAGTGEAETALAAEGSAREHATLVFTLGIKIIVLLINKMDLCNWSEARYNEISRESLSMLKKIGYPSDRVAVIPISGWLGDNITEPSTNMPWYHGWSYTVKDETGKDVKKEGKTILDHMDSLDPPPRPVDKPLRIPISDSFKISGVGTVATGKVECGVLKPGMFLSISPTGLTAEVKSIEMHHQSLDEAKPGDIIGFNLKNVAVNDVRRGYVAGDQKSDPPRPAEKFEAQVISIKAAAKATSGIGVGYTPVIDMHNAHVACRFESFITKIDKRSGKPIASDEPAESIVLKSNEAALAVLVPTLPLTVEEFSQYPALGRFAARDANRTVAIGVVKKVYKKEMETKGSKAAAKGGKK